MRIKNIICGAFVCLFLVSNNMALFGNNEVEFSQTDQLKNSNLNECKKTAFKSCNEPGSKKSKIICLDSEKKVLGDNLGFDFETLEEVNRVSRVDNGEIAFSVEGKYVKCSLFDVPNDSKINLEFYNNSVFIDTYTLYFSKDDSGYCYSSGLSLDVAKRSAGKTLNYQLIDKMELTNNKNNNLEIEPIDIGVTGGITGHFKWTDDQGDIHPLVGAKVVLTIGGSLWSSETYTSANGYYSFSYKDIWYIGSGRPKITLLLDNGESIHVGLESKIYSISNEFEGSSGYFTFSYTFSPSKDGDMGKSAIIYQAAHSYAEFMKGINGNSPIQLCTFHYPGKYEDISSYNNNEVEIATIEPKKGFPTSYSSWDVIGHEYGHHIETIYGFVHNYSVEHWPGVNLIDNLIKEYGVQQNMAKENGLKLAWSEGWATYFSILAQRSFNSDLKSIWTVGDTMYTSYNGLQTDLNVYDLDNSFGDGDEGVVQRILFKLTDPETDAYDTFAIEFSSLLNIIKEKKPLTFFEFIQTLYEKGYGKFSIGSLLSKFNVSTSYLYFTLNNLNSTPVASWDAYMGSQKIFYNSFDLMFFDQNKTSIFDKKGILTSGRTGNYTLTTSEWNRIINATGTKFYVALVSRQTTGFVSGPYYSQMFPINKPNS